MTPHPTFTYTPIPGGRIRTCTYFDKEHGCLNPEAVDLCPGGCESIIWDRARLHDGAPIDKGVVCKI